MVIIVEAGAVAVAIAPSKRAKDQPRFGKHIPITKVTNNPASKASNMVMIIVLIPALFKTFFLKNLPTPKAINPKARSLRNFIPSLTWDGIMFKTYGPIKTPAII